jgi:hypothetical protein
VADDVPEGAQPEASSAIATAIAATARNVI